MTVSPGWYRDPADPASQRYWNGEEWVGEHLPAEVEPPEGPLTAPFAPAPVPAPQPPSGRYEPGAVQPGGWYPEHGGHPAPVPGPQPDALAPLGDRFAARLIDIIAVFGLNLVVNGYFFYLLYQELLPAVRAMERGDPAPPTSAHATNLSLVIALVAMALWFAYEVPAVAATGQTLGKRLLGIRVVTVDGGPVGFRRSIQRWLPQGLPLLLGALLLVVQLLDAAWCLWDKPLRQCLHDKLARTVVVNAPPQNH
ncbi:MAG: domain containing protein [Mycobacterium sp.]|nr:domain containing protein [Mycobacterium sp.]